MVALGRGSPTVAPLRVRVACSALVERGGDLLRRPTEATQAPPAMGRVRRVASFRTCQLGGRLGLLAPDPRQRAFGSLDSHSGGSGRVGGPARGGRAGLAGVTVRNRRTATRSCEAPPIRHGSCRDTFPSGEGAGLRALGRGSPTVAPLRVRVVRSIIGARGGDLLWRPTEITQAPPAMHWCGELLHSRPFPPRQPTSCVLPTSATGPPSCAQRGRPTGAARPPADDRHNTSRRSKPPPRGSN